MSDEKEVIKGEIYKAIGHLDEATEVMKRELEESSKNEEEIVGFFTVVGRILKNIFTH